MPTLTLDRVREQGEAFMEARSREEYLAMAGHKREAALRPIYDRFASTFGRETLDAIRDELRDAPVGSGQHRSARALLEWQAELQASRELVSLDEREIAWEASAIIRVAEGRDVPYQRAMIEIATARSRAERLAIDSARARLVAAELAPLRRERLGRERDIVENLGIADGYLATLGTLSGIDLGALVAQCERLLVDTRAVWESVWPSMVERRLGIAPGEATRADALALLRAPQFDRYFPGAEMERVIRRQVGEMGLDAVAAGRVIWDVGEREGKRSRAFCAPVRVPAEVYLVLRPQGGVMDYRALLHELGHALHFANARADLSFEFRWLGDNSITEGYAMLFDHHLHDRGWLTRYTELSRTTVGNYLREAAFEELHLIRRYAAKLLYEWQLYGGRVRWDDAGDLFVETLASATGFRHHAGDAFVDLDPRLYAARYLIAWQLQAALREVLVQRFDEDWFRNPRAGPWVRDMLFAEGQRELASEQADRIGAGPLSFAPVVRAIEAELGA